MFKITHILKYYKNFNYLKTAKRKFLAPAYHCNEVWESRLNQPIFKKINVEELYYELDSKYQKTKSISFIDVDIFVNAIKDDSFDDEMLDLVHKLRLSSETCRSLPSMSYAVIKLLLAHNKIDDIHTILEDRLNYGIFLDTHITNILLDYFWKKKDFVSGTRIASHLMFQEEDEHDVAFSLGLLHCFNCLLHKGEWPQPPLPEEPEEEIKIRVNYIRNDYNDNHFDLRDCKKIIGKTLIHLTKGKNDSLNTSFSILGHSLFGSVDKAENLLNSSKDKLPLVKEILELIPDNIEIKNKVDGIKLDSKDVNVELESFVKNAINKSSESDISLQCEHFKQWEQKRLECIKEKEEILSKIERMKHIEALQKDLKEKETKLWFFENEEKIELEILEKEELKALEMVDNVKHKVKKNIDEEYIPPTIRS
ncbi:hypothetical protein WA026_014030 [Henosepilachna vigintioctopunctata]|uniref:28S ribosomal protein S27, mitochondrial n=1 Tax=Henosepilachna vigintioctopunctata TaxID=420089 RepID=A0AAW1U286_9CUCU